MNIDSFRIANKADAKAIAQLVNESYRPKYRGQGWTHEADLISGERINAAQIAEAIASDGSIILLGFSGSEAIASVHIEKDGDNCLIGMLAVSPGGQGRGVGKEMLSQAECYANMKFNSKKFTMLVISARSELISFYLRRGYQKTGAVMDYPLSAGAGAPKRTDLKVEVLEKVSGKLLNPEDSHWQSSS